MAGNTVENGDADRPAPEPQGSNRGVELWLWSVAALVFAMIVVGGATRLTGSGLSITEWKPILGAIPPLNESDWLTAFEKYKQIPQYAIVNAGMTLDAFKFIYMWEWSHRLLGRAIGFVFALPFLYFSVSGQFRSGQVGKLITVFLLGGLQGAIGWYMVSSGLADRVSVSEYRLALHLGVAFLLLGTLVWLALDERVHGHNMASGIYSRPIAAGAAAITVIAFLQIILGALVAGLKAGLIYNTWPDMNGQFVPSDYWIEGRGLLSFFESHAAAQFNHRTGAYVLNLAVLFQGWQVWRESSNSATRRSAAMLAAAVILQTGIGILSLLAHVPLHFGLLHQAFGAIVFAIAVWHMFAAYNMSRARDG